MKKEMNERKRLRIESMTEEERDRNWERAQLQMVGMNDEDYRRKYVDEAYIYEIEVGLLEPGHDLNSCLAYTTYESDKPRFLLPRDFSPMALLKAACKEDHCAERDALGCCPSICPRYILRAEHICNEEIINWGLIERLVAEGFDIKTWEPGDDEVDELSADQKLS